MSGAAAIPLGGLLGGGKLLRKGFKYLSKGCSFIRGTRVETYLGLEAIEEIPDDRVTQAKDEVTGELKWARVVNTFAEWHEEVIALEIMGPTGKREEIVTTAEHPFFLADRGWTPASEIRENDKVVLKNDAFGKVLKVEVRAEPQMAYNLDVKDVDTYLVGELGVWVHNSCKVPNPYGSRGGPAHQNKIKERIKELKGQGHKHEGGGDLTEEVVRTRNGCKTCRRPDITTQTPDGKIYRENVGLNTKSGKPVARERRALDDIEKATGVRPSFTSYN